MFKYKIAAVSAASLLLTAIFTGCATTKADNENGKLSIVCTNFSEYDWTRNIVGDSVNCEITYLLESGIDIHNYQPSAQDMLTISECDVFMYIGGESESWVDDALKNSTNKEMKVIRLFDCVSDRLKEEEVKEGMEAEEHGHSHDEHEEHDSDTDEPEYDEHVWLSLRNAEVICTEISDTLSEIDPENADNYRKNHDSYTSKLSALDEQYSKMAEKASTKTVLFGDRFPFRYLTDDYGIDYYAAFAGCSAETEASFRTVAALAEKLDTLYLDTVFIIEKSDDSLAKSIISNSKSGNAAIETLNSIQSVTRNDIDNGETYISIMQDNLDTLKKVLD